MSPRQVKIIEAEALNPGQMLGVMVENKSILLANIDGVVYAIDNQCSHEDALLYNGALKVRLRVMPFTWQSFQFQNRSAYGRTGNRTCTNLPD